MLIYAHPELDSQHQMHLASWVDGCIGVDCAEFDRHARPHVLTVRYDPDAIRGKQILDKARKIDPIASIVSRQFPADVPGS